MTSECFKYSFVVYKSFILSSLLFYSMLISASDNMESIFIIFVLFYLFILFELKIIH
jgi:hypothetical protein